jgi:Na+/H+-dicarboxylate symporter
VPLLLAFIPQNIFYALNNDVLSPVCFGALFLCVLEWLRTRTVTLLLGVVTGLAIAATYLTKLSNLPLVAVAVIAIIAKLPDAVRQKRQTALTAFAALFLSAAMPIGCWIVWTRYQFGDLTGSAAKKSLCSVGRTNRFQTGGSIQFLQSKGFGFFGATS